MFDRIRYAFRALLRRSALEREMHDEMQYHLEQRTATLVAGGLSARDARLAARREFGNVASHQENGRDARPARFVHTLIADIRFALRYFRRKPLASCTIVFVLALGIGGHAFQMSLMLAVTTRRAAGIPTDVPIARMRGMQRPNDSPQWSAAGISYVAIRELAQLRGTFASVGAWTTQTVVANNGKGTEGETTLAHFVSEDYFSVLGLRPTNGPGLPRAASESQLVAVISNAMWEDAFGRADIADREITVNGTAVRIVGVAPEKFGGVEGGEGRRIIWMPLSARSLVLGPSGATPIALSSPDSLAFQAVARLQPRVTPEQATAAVHVVARQVAARMTPPPNIRAQRTATIYDADVVDMRGLTDVGSDMPLITAVWSVITLLVLLIACANVSALVVSAGVARRQEIAVRLSLGASRRRIIRQLVTETTLLAIAGGALGLAIYWAIIKAMSAIPETEFITPSFATVGLTMLVALATGILFGLTPALHATRADVSEVLKGAGHGATRRSRLQGRFVIAQIALTQPLLMVFGTAAGGMFLAERATLPAAVAERALDLHFDGMTIPGDDRARAVVLQRLEQRLKETPSVVGVTPGPRFELTTKVSPRGGDAVSQAGARNVIPVSFYRVREGYFGLLDVPLLRGTDVPFSDSSLSVVISSELARELWGAADPIGRRLVRNATQPSADQSPPKDYVVTGVYDARYIDKGATNARIFHPVRDWWNDDILIRTNGPAENLAMSIRRSAHDVLPATPMEVPSTLAAIDVENSKEQRNIQLAVFGGLALVLLLASVGLYGVVALAVEQQRREIGVRIALGARSRQVVAMFCANGAKLGVVSLAIGMPLSVAGIVLFNSVRVRPTDRTEPSAWLVASVIAAIVLIVALVASLFPASRASKVDPILALRSE
jgi:predicted permease